MVMDDHAHRYGAAHKRQRKFYADAMAAGATYRCTRCGQPVDKRTPSWHLDHQPGGGPRDWAGPAHETCNTAVNAKQVTGARPAEPTKPSVGACGSTRQPPLRANWRGDPDWDAGHAMCYERSGDGAVDTQCDAGCPWTAWYARRDATLAVRRPLAGS